MKRFEKRVVVTAGVIFLCAASGLAGSQATPSVGVPGQPLASPAARPRRNIPPPDILAGLTLADDQKAKIEKIRQNTKSRQEAVYKDTKLSPEVKDAMMHGYIRIANSEIFEVLTPQQQQEARKRISTWRASVQQGQPSSPQQRQMPPRALQQPVPAQPVK